VRSLSQNQYHSSDPFLFSELGGHLQELDAYLGTKLPQTDVTLKDRIEVWWNKCEEVLSAEAIAKMLPEVNRKITFSIQKFMVRNVVCASFFAYSADALLPRWEVRSKWR
jgi:hypothetical protein